MSFDEIQPRHPGFYPRSARAEDALTLIGGAIWDAIDER